MASVYIVPRRGKTRTSFAVKYRLHGRYSKIEHAGSFRTKGDAERRARKVREWIAEVKDPRVELARFHASGLSVGELGREWLGSKRRVRDSTVAEYARRVSMLEATFGDIPADRLTVRDVNDWIDRLGTKKPSTVREYVMTLGMILDWAGVPNVARDRRVEIPRHERRVLSPPDAAATLRVLEEADQRSRALLVLIEQTGLRVSEACAVEAGHLDGNRLLVPDSKTHRPRWVPVPPWLSAAIDPPWKLTRQTVSNDLRGACGRAGVGRFGPHMLRHRRASLWSAQGVPPAQAAEWLGHSLETFTRTYVHVVSAGEIDAQRLARLLSSA